VRLARSDVQRLELELGWWPPAVELALEGHPFLDQHGLGRPAVEEASENLFSCLRSPLGIIGEPHTARLGAAVS
jgi:hypothetical protein